MAGDEDYLYEVPATNLLHTCMWESQRILERVDVGVPPVRRRRR
jgi:hypothetical protein